MWWKRTQPHPGNFPFLQSMTRKCLYSSKMLNSPTRTLPFTFECLKKQFMNIHILEDLSPKGPLVVPRLISRWFLSKTKKELETRAIVFLIQHNFDTPKWVVFRWRCLLLIKNCGNQRREQPKLENILKCIPHTSNGIMFINYSWENILKDCATKPYLNFSTGFHC